ncbi:DNA-directed RNA polymerase II subunit RPB11-a-like [Planoprotostelium fungivorum]|uniref:DNA-directed RNA polymerase II subunit RPB11-a-like n=1 Tax=Planoprotostelium fungivorum TaxID=1890364 RepID=A0A2P6MQU6_9EUKA|nr:DNA-directed RNA polymerase II subunit RPB11-a-like [Planoprotostelium fungivorum]
MNRPDDYELFVLNEGQKKVSVQNDTKVKNCSLFTMQKEDHTLGNIIRMQLHRDKDVVFAGYRMPHPLEHAIAIRVQTNGNETPERALATSLTDLISEFSLLEERCRQALEQKKKPEGYM